jgi:hypothetical protein
MKIPAAIPLVMALVGPAAAQSTAEFNQSLGACSAQQDRMKRLSCFERLAREAVAELDKRQNAPAVPSAVPPPAPAAKVSQHAAFIAKAKANISVSFKDPSSVQYRDLYVSESGSRALCGEINAKNSYGGYVGFRRFFATDEPVLQDIEDPKQPTVMATMWGLMCGKEVERVEQLSQ